MIRITLTILLSISLQYAWAQVPLSKRDQKLKAEFEAQIEAEKKYDKLMKEADEAFRMQDYAQARQSYNAAIQYNAEQEQWLISKVNDLDILMAEIIAREVDSVLVIKSKPLPMIEQKEVKQRTIESRNEQMVVALQPRSEDTIVTPEIKEESSDSISEEIAETSNEEEEEVIEVEPAKAPTPVVKKAPPTKPVVKKDNVEEKVVEDYSRFPQGRSDETFTFPDHTVRRVVVKDKRDVIVYKYVTYRWGGKFYFKDGVSIVERIWKQEVAEYEAKFPKNLAN